MSEININLLAYLFTRMHPETRFNSETVALISPCFSFAEKAQSFVNVASRQYYYCIGAKRQAIKSHRCFKRVHL